MIARQVADAPALEDLLLAANYDHGEAPELTGYDRFGRVAVAWLIDGGDDAPMRVALLGGPDGGHPELIDVEANTLAYPLSVLVPASWTWLA